MEAMLALGYKAVELKKIKKFWEGTIDVAETISSPVSRCCNRYMLIKTAMAV